jgi:hypothetical protein
MTKRILLAAASQIYDDKLRNLCYRLDLQHPLDNEAVQLVKKTLCSHFALRFASLSAPTKKKQPMKARIGITSFGATGRSTVCACISTFRVLVFPHAEKHTCTQALLPLQPMVNYGDVHEAIQQIHAPMPTGTQDKLALTLNCPFHTATRPRNETSVTLRIRSRACIHGAVLCTLH